MNSVAFSSDGQRAVSFSALDRRFHLWDVSAGKSIVSSSWSDDCYRTSIDISSKGKLIVSAFQMRSYNDICSYDNVIFIDDAISGKSVQKLSGHNGKVNSAVVCGDGHLVISASDDMTIRLWDVFSGRCMKTLTGHTGGVNCVSVSRDGRLVISGGNDGVVFLWDVASGRCLRTFRGHNGSVTCVSLNLEGRLAISSGADGTVRLWDLDKGSPRQLFKDRSSRVSSVVLATESRWAFSSHINGKCHLFDLTTEECLRTLDSPAGAVLSACLTVDSRWLLSGHSDGSLLLWELDWDFEGVKQTNWDEGARPYLETFLTLHTPYAGTLPEGREPSEEEIQLALTRRGTPKWTEEDFKQLLYTLGCAGYGWLRPEGVKRELEEMTSIWDGPPTTTPEFWNPESNEISSVAMAQPLSIQPEGSASSSRTPKPRPTIERGDTRELRQERIQPEETKISPVGVPTGAINDVHAYFAKEGIVDAESFKRGLEALKQGNILISKGKASDALEHLERAVQLLEKSGHEQSLALAYSLMTDVCETSEEFEKGIESGSKAIVIYQKIGPDRKMMECWSQLSRLQLKRGNREQAIEAGKKAVAIARRINSGDTFVVGAFVDLARAFLKSDLRTAGVRVRRLYAEALERLDIPDPDRAKGFASLVKKEAEEALKSIGKQGE